MARKRAAKQEAAAGQDAAIEPAVESNGGNGSMTKGDAVHAALAAGFDQPEEGIAYIKKQFDIDMTRPQFSTNKSLIKKKDGESGPKKPGRQPRAAAPAVAAQMLAPKPSTNGAAGLAGSVEAIKSLVEQYGVEEVVSIARLFGK